ncbi:MAG: type II/IV secretion system ATPase subunit [Nanobdellota archaeon]
MTVKTKGTTTGKKAATPKPVTKKKANSASKQTAKTAKKKKTTTAVRKQAASQKKTTAKKKTNSTQTESNTEKKKKATSERKQAAKPAKKKKATKASKQTAKQAAKKKVSTGKSQETTAAKAPKKKPKGPPNKAEFDPDHYRFTNPFLNELFKLHQDKESIIQQFSYNRLEKTKVKLLDLSSKQLQILDHKLGLAEMDWDKLVYTDEGKDVVIRRLFGEKAKLNKEQKELINHILVYLKTFYLSVKEEKNDIQNSDTEELTRKHSKEEAYLLRLNTYISQQINLDEEELIDQYEFKSKNIPVTARVVRRMDEFISIYDVNIASLTKQTEYFLEKIRRELINKVKLGMADITDIKKNELAERKFSETIVSLISKYFPDMDDETQSFLTTYLIQKSLGLGKIELLMGDSHIEEIAINSAKEPIWIFHKKHGWLKTTIHLENEDQVRHYAMTLGRKVGRSLSVLEPLLDASFNKGDRVNATLTPISHQGNTITIRKASSKPWTITDLIRSKTISPHSAALIWLGMQYELSALIAGGTASGKTSMLNSLAGLFPINQRIISIEDTKEIQLPKYLHWVPMLTRPPNNENKGAVTMLDLVVNSLRQRPDRILVGEIRRKKEAEVLFEAMHTGHSVYATIHANTAEEVITRLTNPPIDIPKAMIPALSIILVQYRNRRSGLRRTFQFAEVTPKGEAKVLHQYDAQKDNQIEVNKSQMLMNTIQLFTGLSQKEIMEDINDKIRILKWLQYHNINDVDKVGKAIGEYYTNPHNFFKYVNRNIPFE